MGQHVTWDFGAFTAFYHMRKLHTFADAVPVELEV